MSWNSLIFDHFAELIHEFETKSWVSQETYSWNANRILLKSKLDFDTKLVSRTEIVSRD